MRFVRGAGGAALVVVALAVGAGWTTVASHTAAPVRAVPQEIERALAGAITAADAPIVAAEPSLRALRGIDSRSGPTWLLPGLVAALAALCLLRRLRVLPVGPGHPHLLFGPVSRRGPPLASLS